MDWSAASSLCLSACLLLACGDDNGSDPTAGSDSATTGTSATSASTSTNGTTGTETDGTASASATSSTGSSGSSAGSTGSTGTGGGVCGDGDVAGGEDCDDANMIADDGCENDCTWTPGTQIWEDHTDGAGEGDAAYGVAVGPDGSVVAVGRVRQGGYYDGYVKKLNPDGTEAWAQAINGPGMLDDDVRGVTVGPNGRIHVTGRQTLGGGAKDPQIWVAELPPGGGDPVWEDLFGATTEEQEEGGYGIARLSGGDLVVVGAIMVSGQVRQLVRRYTAAGAEVWTFQEDPGFAYGVAVAGGDRIVVTGENGVGIGADMFARTFDENGGKGWNEVFDGPAGQRDVGFGVAVDPGGNAYLAGAMTQGTNRNVWIMKLDTAGLPLWMKGYSGTYDDHDEGHGIAIDANGDVIVTGVSREAGGLGNGDVWLQKYDADGTEIWSVVFDGGVMGHDAGWGVATDPDDHSIYVAGEAWLPAQDGNFWVGKYAP